MVILRIRLGLRTQEILRLNCNPFSNKGGNTSKELILELEQSFAARY